MQLTELNRAWTGLAPLNLSILMANNFYCAINCLNMNRVIIYRAKYLVIVALKVLPTSYFRYNSEKKSIIFPVPKTELNRVNKSFPLLKYVEDFEKMVVFINLFVHISRKVYTFISILHKCFFFPNEGSIACKCFQ